MNPSRESKSNRTAAFAIVQCSGQERSSRLDQVVLEEPMEIRLLFGPTDKRTVRSLSVTMRTPGEDDELAAGFLFSEGILSARDQIEQIEARGVDQAGKSTGNTIRVAINPDVPFDMSRLQRHFYTTSSCGVCGKASLDLLEIKGLKPLTIDWQVPSQAILRLPSLLRAAQPTFELTGGLHAAGLATPQGDLLAVREDVGRHNAVDKLIGRAFLDGQTPMDQRLLVISGRVSFEIMQKALVARIPILVAVGAPTSLAIEVARQFNITLVGFTNDQRFNLYSAPHRLRDPIEDLTRF